MPAPTERRAYATDLTDAQWEILRPYLQRPRGPGRLPRLDLREVVNALFYFTRSGCQWRLLPHEFPKWESVRYYFDKWSRDGTWEQINAALVQPDEVPPPEATAASEIPAAPVDPEAVIFQFEAWMFMEFGPLGASSVWVPLVVFPTAVLVESDDRNQPARIATGGFVETTTRPARSASRVYCRDAG